MPSPTSDQVHVPSATPKKERSKMSDKKNPFAPKDDKKPMSKKPAPMAKKPPAMKKAPAKKK